MSVGKLRWLAISSFTLNQNPEYVMCRWPVDALNRRLQIHWRVWKPSHDVIYNLSRGEIEDYLLWRGQSLNWDDAKVISCRAKACCQSSCISLAVTEAFISTPCKCMSLYASQGFRFARCLNLVCRRLVGIPPRAKDPPLVASSNTAQKNINPATKEKMHVDIVSRIRRHNIDVQYNSLPATALG